MPKNAKSTKTITEKLADLDAAMEWFYGDKFSLDAALDKYQAASKLASEIEQDLATLKNQIEVIGDFTKH